MQNVESNIFWFVGVCITHVAIFVQICENYCRLLARVSFNTCVFGLFVCSHSFWLSHWFCNCW